MAKNKLSYWQVVGVVGTVVALVLFVRQPSFPTPDKLVIFLTFVFMIFSQALPMLKRLLPFVAILLAYESFRGIADYLNSNVNYSLPAGFDEALFGQLPTVILQNLLWNGAVAWYDFVFYFPYLLHFVLPVGLALLIWKVRETEYWRFITTFLLVSFFAFFTFLVFPAAPPWMASEQGYIEPLERISSDVWLSLGLEDFPSVYNQISPNPVAAVPSHHAAWAFLIPVFVFRLFGHRWGAVSMLYPFLIFTGTVYQGEHFVFDVVVGVIYALAAYMLTPPLLRQVNRHFLGFQKRRLAK